MFGKKTVVVTGSSRGIGSATIDIFAKHNYNVVINYNKSKVKAFDLLKKVRDYGVSAIALQADVSKIDEANYLIDKAVSEFGRIDVLVNNAGIAQQKLFTEIADSEWKSMFDVNVNGTFYCTQRAVKHMLRVHSGKVINVSSILGISGASCEVHYSAAKAALIGFTKALSRELGPSNIQVNCVAPGIIDTDMSDYIPKDTMKELIYQTPLGRMGTPEDIAGVILFLASDESNFITGQVISPNGGFLI